MTLIELLVALTITSVLLLALSSLLSAALNQWSRQTDGHLSNSEAQQALAVLVEDLQSIVPKSGDSEWLQVRAVTVEDLGPTAQLLFLSRPLDDGGRAENHGDVCALSYRLEKRDPFGGNEPVHALFRARRTPEETIAKLGAEDLYEAHWNSGDGRATRGDDLLAINVVGFDLTFRLRQPDGVEKTLQRSFGLRCSGRLQTGENGAGAYPAGTRLTSVLIELTTIDRRAQSLLEEGTLPLEEIVIRFGHAYSTTVELPAPILP